MLLNKDELHFLNSDSTVPKSKVFHPESNAWQSLMSTRYVNTEDCTFPRDFTNEKENFITE